ncbi:MAG: hydroxyacid dehydrogenase [Alphaproteobacteria bacterium]|nr:hydroxyacid dehydrogenase [Alphaproteobacteria bacterium]
MSTQEPAQRPLVISAPAPRDLDLIFTANARKDLQRRYDIHEVDGERLDELPDNVLAEARYIIGQPSISPELLDRLSSLRCVFNVEGNLIDNMPYDRLFERGIHVVTTLSVFAQPVAEIGLCFALNMLRDVVEADTAFRDGREDWGLASNQDARLLFGSDVGIVGYGEIGRALHRLLAAFHVKLSVFDPWLPASTIRDAGAEPVDFDSLFSKNDVVFIAAAVTTKNQGFIDEKTIRMMRPDASLILLSRADVVDFDALIAAVKEGRIRAASDVFPQEPMPYDHPVRQLPGFLKSAHRAGALDSAFKKMGDLVLEDMALLDRGLPPVRCKRAERETVSLMRSRPVSVN